MQMTHFSVLQLFLFIAITLLGIQPSWATRCLEGQKATTDFSIDNATNTTHTTAVTPIRVTNSNQSAGTLLWQSPVYSTTFTCYDDYARNATEKAYLYLDDVAKNLATAFRNSNLIVGINYNGVDYPIDSLTEYKVDTGLLAISSRSNDITAKNNCALIGKQVSSGWPFYRPTKNCADPKTITISYSLYVKSRGSGKNYTDSAKSYQVFQLDGEFGRNVNGNFQEKVSNISVTYIDCITNLNTNNVNLGNYYTYQNTNTILRRTPFIINVTTTGRDCAKYPFIGKFTSTQAYDKDTITPSETGMKNVIGIKVYSEGSNQAIPLNTIFDFGSINTTVLTKNFEAGVLFLSKPSTAGEFTAILNYEIYFK